MSSLSLLMVVLAVALDGCGAAAPPATVAEPEAHAATCNAFQELREGACVYGLPEEARCMQGDAAACTVAGHEYITGEDVAGDEAHAAELYDRACHGDDAEGCAALGELRAEGRGVPQDVADAARLYSLACELGESLACTVFGDMLAAGEGVDQDLARAATLFERACGEGEPYGCGDLAALYAAGTSVERNTLHAIELYTRACDANVAFACNNLGALFEFNVDVEQDAARALALYEQACSMGLPLGCYNVGRVHAEGNIIAPDVGRGVVLLRDACDEGLDMACTLAGRLDAAAPTADETTASCGQPTALTLGREVTGTTEGGVNGLVATCGATASSPDRVYALTLTRPTRVQVDLVAAFDGVVHIRTACSVDATSQVACNDDARGDTSAAAERHSHLQVDLPRGRYFIVVDGYAAGAAGTYRLQVDRVP